MSYIHLYTGHLNEVDNVILEFDYSLAMVCGTQNFVCWTGQLPEADVSDIVIVSWLYGILGQILTLLLASVRPCEEGHAMFIHIVCPCVV